MNSEFTQNRNLVEQNNQTLNENQEIEKIKATLEANLSALMLAKLQLLQNSQTALRFVDDLENLRNYVAPEGNELISKIISYCKSKSSYINWNEFEAFFENVHPGFYQKIQSDFSNLSLNDRKLCALIKLNFSTKEISSITNHSVDAVKKAKTRLKAKLNLDSLEKLYQFIQQIY